MILLIYFQVLTIGSHKLPSYGLSYIKFFIYSPLLRVQNKYQQAIDDYILFKILV